MTTSINVESHISLSETTLTLRNSSKKGKCLILVRIE
jgi:hypothetical protein